jgi:phage-related protein
MEFNAYEYSQPVEYTGTGEIEVYNPGTVESPAIVTLTPSVRINPVHLTGICHDSYIGTDLPVTVPELLQDTPVIIDGVTGLITQDGSPKEIEAWTLPSFKPGTTTVTCDSSYVEVTIKVFPLIK